MVSYPWLLLHLNGTALFEKLKSNFFPGVKEREREREIWWRERACTEGSSRGSKKKKKSHAVFMLNACPGRGVHGPDNGVIRATCVWMTFF